LRRAYVRDLDVGVFMDPEPYLERITEIPGMLEDSLKGGRWFRIAFFAQQAVGKALKALFFIVRREKPPKLYTVTELYAMLKESGFTLPPELEQQLYVLNKYYTVTRYPDAANGLPSESVDRVEAERAYS